MDDLDGMDPEQVLRYAKHYLKQVELLKKEKLQIEDINRKLIDGLELANEEMKKAISHNHLYSLQTIEQKAQMEVMMDTINELMYNHPNAERIAQSFNENMKAREEKYSYINKEILERNYKDLWNKHFPPEK